MNKPHIIYKQTLKEDLKTDLLLHKCKYVYAVRVFGFAIPIYIIIYNSRRPQTPISKQKIQNFKFLKVLKYVPIVQTVKQVKTSPPLFFDMIESLLTSNTMLIVCDIAGYYFYDRKFYDEPQIM